MKTKIYRSVAITLLICTVQLHARPKIGAGGVIINTVPVAPYISQRSQSARLPRQIVATRNIERELICSDACLPGYIGSTFTFSKSFNGPSISDCLFGSALINNGCCQAMRVSGSRVVGRDNNNDLLADYFGLPTDFISTLNFNPRIVNTLNDYQLYLRLDRFLCGLWLYMHAPVVHTQWNLNMQEDIANPGTSGYSEGYFSADFVTRANLLPSATAFFNGATPNIAGQKFNALRYAHISAEPCGNHTKTQLADLQFWLGIDLINRKNYSLSTGIIVVAPTGNRPEARYLFEPMVGNGHHWEVGGLVRGECTLWQNCDQTHSLRAFTQGNITHLCSAQQRRTFDLTDNELSRYTLAQKLGPNTDFPFLGGAAGGSLNPCPPPEDLFMYVTSDAQFANEYTPVANLTTFCVDVRIDYQIDWVTMLTLTHDNFTWDIGYNIWARSCEKISTKCCDGHLITPNTWALKGTARVYGFQACDINGFTLNNAVPLAATDSQATIFASRNSAGSPVNSGIDNPQNAYGANSATNPTAFTVLRSGRDINTSFEISTSIQPVFLSDADIDICGAQTRGLSNAVFTHFGYRWDCECWQPYVGIGGEAEFASGHRVTCASASCNSGSCGTLSCPEVGCQKGCNKCGISQWSLWLKGGFVFG